jgi:hypothetical protein
MNNSAYMQIIGFFIAFVIIISIAKALNDPIIWIFAILVIIFTLFKMTTD